MSADSKPPRRLQFSLITLLLLVVTIGAILLAFIVGRENERLRLANAALREKFGILEIEDPTKACFLARKPKYPLAPKWSWNIYLPPGKTFRLSFAGNKIPANGVFQKPEWGWSPIPPEAQGRQITINASIEMGEIFITSEEFWTSSLALDYDVPIEPKTEMTVGAANQETIVQPGEPMVLLRIRIPLPETDECSGALIWIWEVSKEQLEKEAAAAKR